MGRRQPITFIVSNLSGVPARKFTLPKLVAGLGAVVCVILALAMLLSSLHYFYMWKQSGDYQVLKREVDRLRRQNESFRVTAKQLTDRVSSMEVSAQKLRILSGAEDEGLGGVGGPAASTDLIFRMDANSLLKHFSSLDRKSISLTGELRKLQEFYKDRSILLAATPSIMPVRGYPSDRYGMRTDPFTAQRGFHPGLDISAPRGNKVVATADGTVNFSGYRVGYGKLVTIRHRFGITTRYGHLARLAVVPGQKIRKGDVVGYVGSTGRATGPHVHYEVRLNSRPLDPLRFFQDQD